MDQTINMEKYFVFACVCVYVCGGEGNVTLPLSHCSNPHKRLHHYNWVKTCYSQSLDEGAVRWGKFFFVL